jgi:hypothetical protein
MRANTSPMGHEWRSIDQPLTRLGWSSQSSRCTLLISDNEPRLRRWLGRSSSPGVAEMADWLMPMLEQPFRLFDFGEIMPPRVEFS